MLTPAPRFLTLVVAEGRRTSCNSKAVQRRCWHRSGEFWDYASIIAYLVPNRFHSKITYMTEGRREADVFPTFYRSNTFTGISKLSGGSNFVVERCEYLGQYPCYFTFSRPLFYIGSLYEKFLERHRRLHFLRGWILCILSKRLYPDQSEGAT